MFSPYKLKGPAVFRMTRVRATMLLTAALSLHSAWIISSSVNWGLMCFSLSFMAFSLLRFRPAMAHLKLFYQVKYA